MLLRVFSDVREMLILREKPHVKIYIFLKNIIFNYVKYILI